MKAAEDGTLDEKPSDPYYAQKYTNENYFTIPDSYYATPELGDFYLGAVDTTYLQMFDKNLDRLKKGSNGDAKKAAFYTEAPPLLNNNKACQDDVYFLSADFSTDFSSNNWQDASTLRVKIGNLSCTNSDTLATFKKMLAEKENPYGALGDDDYITVKLYGITCPAETRSAVETLTDKNKSYYKVVEVTEDEVKKYPAKYIGGATDDNKKVNEDTQETYYKFVDLDGTYYALSSSSSSNAEWILHKRTDKDDSSLTSAVKLLTTVLEQSDDKKIYFQIDAKAGNSGIPSYFSSISKSEYARELLKLWALGTYSGATNGYCLAKEDYSGRFWGSAYIKIQGKWVNIVKALLSSVNEQILNAQEAAKQGKDTIKINVSANNNFNSSNPALFPATYDEDEQTYADAFFATLEELDDRKKIQKEIFGQEWEDLHKWTVTIGDVTMFIPPTAISVTTETTEERMPLLRASGSMAKSGKRTTKSLTMELYFYGDQGINGYEYKTKAPNEAELTYYINGFRALVSEFKFTPFLPIENEYINDTLGIHAVVFENFTFSNVNDIGPKLIHATLSLTEFDYGVYMPELCMLCSEYEYQGNQFAASINWGTMRYYYQRAIARGEEMSKLDGGVNSKEYLLKALANRTALQRAKFSSSYMKMYVPDQDYLEKMLEQRRKVLENKQNAANLTNADEALLKKIGNIAAVANTVIQSDAFKERLNLINDTYCTNADWTVLLKDGETERLYAYSTKELEDTSHKPDKETYYDYLDDDIVSLLTLIKTELLKNEYVKNVSFTTQIRTPKANAGLDYKKVSIGLSIGFQEGNDFSSDNIDHLRKTLSTALHVQSSSIMADNRLRMWLSIKLEKDIKKSALYATNSFLAISTFSYYPQKSDSTFYMDEEEADALLCAYALPYAESTTSSDSNSAEGWQTSPSIYQLDNMKFNYLDLGNFYITDFTVQMRNRISRLNVCDVNGSSPQFLGGEDTVLNIVIKTRDQNCVNILSDLPVYSTTIMRRYREVIPCFPLKIDSGFTRLLGIGEVSISNVQVDTVPNQPGVYIIMLSMVSVDRTLRNREALQMIEVQNAGSISDPSDAGERNIKSYFDMDSIISQAELYPDLELPRIDELSTLGWHFVRYKFQDSRVYVDPDFYFVYMTQLTSQYLREVILQSVDNGVDGTHTIRDTTGSEATIKPQKKVGFEAVSNEALKNQIQAINDIEKARLQLGSKRKINSLKTDSAANKVDDFEGWEVCNDIKAFFLEKQYLKELETYESVASKYDSKYLEYNSETEAAAQETNDIKYVEEQKDNYEKIDQESRKDGTVEQNGETNDAKIDDQVFTEGAWVHGQLLNTAGKAYSLIMDYIRSTPISLESPEVATIREQYIQDKVYNRDVSSYYTTMETEIKNQVKDFLNRNTIKEILELIGVDVSSDFLSVSADIIYAAACAATGEKEFSSKKKSVEWRPAVDFIGIGATGNSQDQIEASPIYSVETAIYNATQFGCFKIRQYSIQEYRNLYQGRKQSLNGVISSEDLETAEIYAAATNEERAAVSDWGDKASTVASVCRVLDPYYSSTERTKDEVVEYIRGCINSPAYCTEAFMRNVLYYLAVLMDYKVIPSINGDLLRSSNKANDYETNKKKYYGAGTEGDTTSLDSKNKDISDHLKFFTKNIYTLDAGKIWAATLLTVSDRNEKLFQRMIDRDIKGLNELSNCVSIPASKINPDDKASMQIRKMELALIGLKRNTQASAQGIPQDSPSVKAAREMVEKKYFEAAEDVTQYTRHSCHDMIVHDGRGRMIRAFPTYYMLFIDEGRDIGTYHLHDNFYNNSCISEFTVVKDRKNPADTANIVMGNFYQSFSVEDDDRLQYESVGWGDAVSSIFSPIFSPETYGKYYEEKRSNKTVQSQIRIRPGARIHLRAGYGSNATMLPILFNGTIAEVSTEDVVNIIAQGDGVELMNPIQFNTTANSLANDSGYKTNKNTPANLMRDILLTTGTVLQSAFKYVANRPDLLGANPFGIYHFGDRDYKKINATGEVCQNIFEALPNPAWGETDEGCINSYNKQNASNTGLKVPEINFTIFQKTPWQCANICKSVSPDFICGVAPFDYRSTLFIGAPRYYYAYGYTNINGAIQEKRKPYQQYHLYTSSTDIIANGIAASSKNIHTNAVGLYRRDGVAGSQSQSATPPLYVDMDIYPENQKSMIVDTQLGATGIPYIGTVTNLVTSNEVVDTATSKTSETFNEIFDSTNEKTKGKSESLSWGDIAWNMTASALKDSMKDMYCGDMVVMGDATVKPHDRIFIADTFQSISGQATVKEVVHSMSVNEGFVTTISPDLISSVKDPYEIPVHNWVDKTMGIAATSIIGIVATYATYKYGVSLNAIKGLGEYEGYKKLKDMAEKLYEKIRVDVNIEQTIKDLGTEQSTLSEDIKTLEKTISEKDATNDAKEIEELQKKISEKKDKLKEIQSTLKKKESVLEDINKGKEQLSKLSKEVSNILPEKVTNLASKASEKGSSAIDALSNLKSTCGNGVTTVAKKSGVAKLLSSPVAKVMGRFLWWFGTISLVGNIIGTMLTKMIRNYQIMTIFPLRHHDLVWTAGMAGSKGLIYGSPSYYEQGAVQSLIAAAVPEENSLGMGVISWLLGDQLIDVCKSYQRGYSNEDYLTDVITTEPVAYTELRESGNVDDNTSVMKYVAQVHNGLADTPNDYRRLQMTARCEYNDVYSADEDKAESREKALTQLNYCLQYFGMLDIDVAKFANDPKFTRNEFISNDARISQYIKEGFFKIAHEDPNASNSSYPRSEVTVLKVNGMDREVKYLVDDYVYDSSTDSNIVVYDFPMLNPDAMHILYEIIKRAKNYMPGAKSSDPYEFYDEVKNSYIVLTSALRVGDSTSLGCCGFSFVLKGTDKAQEALTQAVQELHNEITKDNESTGVTPQAIFYTEANSDNTQIKFHVSMPLLLHDTPEPRDVSFEEVNPIL